MSPLPPRSHRAWLLLWALSAASCTSRTLPLPPPGEVEAQALADQPGMARVTGLAHEGAAVGIMSEETFGGVITTSAEEGCDRSCPFEAVIEAELGEPLRVWQFFETGNAAMPNVE